MRGGGLILSKDSILIVQPFPSNGSSHFWKGKPNNELQHRTSGTDSNRIERFLDQDSGIIMMMVMMVNANLQDTDRVHQGVSRPPLRLAGRSSGQNLITAMQSCFQTISAYMVMNNVQYFAD